MALGVKQMREVLTTLGIGQWNWSWMDPKAVRKVIKCQGRGNCGLSQVSGSGG